MPWQHCDQELSDDQSACPACGTNKQAWTVEFNSTREFVVPRSPALRLVLLDAEDIGVAGEPYRVDLGGGEVIEGELDEEGSARIACSSGDDVRVTFPERAAGTVSLEPTQGADEEAEPEEEAAATTEDGDDAAEHERDGAASADPAEAHVTKLWEKLRANPGVDEPEQEDGEAEQDAGSGLTDEELAEEGFLCARGRRHTFRLRGGVPVTLVQAAALKLAPEDRYTLSDGGSYSTSVEVRRAVRLPGALRLWFDPPPPEGARVTLTYEPASDQRKAYSIFRDTELAAPSGGDA